MFFDEDVQVAGDAGEDTSNGTGTDDTATPADGAEMPKAEEEGGETNI